MARATNSPASRKRRKKVLKYAKGYFGNKSKLFRYAKEAVQHAWQYAYRDRKKKKGEWRSLWIVRLNADDAKDRGTDMLFDLFLTGWDHCALWPAHFNFQATMWIRRSGRCQEGKSRGWRWPGCCTIRRIFWCWTSRPTTWTWRQKKCWSMP